MVLDSKYINLFITIELQNIYVILIELQTQKIILIEIYFYGLCRPFALINDKIIIYWRNSNCWALKNIENRKPRSKFGNLLS